MGKRDHGTQSGFNAVLCGLFTLQVIDSDTVSDSDGVPVFGSQDWTMNLTQCSLKTSAQCSQCNVAIGFAV